MSKHFLLRSKVTDIFRAVSTAREARQSRSRLATRGAATRFAAESLEERRMLVTASCYPTFAGGPEATGHNALTIASGASVTLQAHVIVNYDYYGPQYNPDPTGTVTLEWFRTDNIGDPVSAGATLITQSQGVSYANITATLFKPEDPNVVQDQYGDYRLEVYYSGDDALFSQSSLPIPLGADGTGVQPYTDAFIGVKFTDSAKLVVSTQPTNTAKGDTINPVKVELHKTTGEIDTSATGTVTAQLSSSSTGTGTLTGTTTASFAGGVATFSNLMISADGQYSLTFADANGDTAVSSTFQIGSGLAVKAQPTNSSPGDAIAPAVRVAVVNDAGKVITTAKPTPITASLASSSTGTGTLSGSTTATTVRGVASFKNLSINKPGDYTLNFTNTDGVTVSSAQFTISTAKLIFKGQISNGIPGSALHPAIKVELLDKKGHLITTDSSLVTLSIKTGPAASGANPPLTGNTAQLVNGVAVFSNLKFSTPGDYTLSATDDQNDAAATSNDFKITGLHLAFKTQPQETGTGAKVRYVVALEDYRNRLVNTSSVGLGLGLGILEGGAGAVLSSVADTVDFGQAVNSGSSPATINVPGTYTITFTVISQNVDAFDYTIDPITSNSFKVVANHLQFVRQPASRAAGVSLVYEVALKDYRGKVITTNNTDQLKFTLIPSDAGSGAVLTGGVDTLLGGIANDANNSLSIDTPGTYRLAVVDVPADPSAAVAAGVTSIPFKIFGNK